MRFSDSYDMDTEAGLARTRRLIHIKIDEGRRSRYCEQSRTVVIRAHGFMLFADAMPYTGGHHHAERPQMRYITEKSQSSLTRDAAPTISWSFISIFAICGGTTSFSRLLRLTSTVESTYARNVLIPVMNERNANGYATVPTVKAKRSSFTPVTVISVKNR